MNYCKICEGKTKIIKDDKKGLIYYRCKVCDFIFLDHAFFVTKEREKFQYDQHNNGFENLGYVRMFELFIRDVIDPYLSEVKSALDFGCGPGPVLSKLLRKRDIEVDEYDLYFVPKKVYENKKYDLITSTEVFEHLQNPLDILTLLVKHLSSRGYIILMTKFPPKEDEVFLNWWYRRDVTHISFFTPKSFEVMGEKVGLKVLEIKNDNVVVFQKIC